MESVSFVAFVARIVHMSPELRAMMNGVISALTTVFWGLLGCSNEQTQKAEGFGSKRDDLGYSLWGYMRLNWPV